MPSHFSAQLPNDRMGVIMPQRLGPSHGNINAMDDSADDDKNGDDALRATVTQIIQTLSNSRRIWGGLRHEAEETSGIPLACLDVKGLLCKAPSIPSYEDISNEFVEDQALYLEGQSFWALGSTNCDLKDKFKKSQKYRVSVGSPNITYCTLGKQCLDENIQSDAHHGDLQRYLVPMMVLGWCYVFSALLVEARRASTDDRVSYTELRCDASMNLGQGESKHGLSIGSVEQAELRWWTAILAPGSGWQAVINRSGRDFHPPWSCHLNSATQLSIHYKLKPGAVSTVSPPDSRKSREYLYRFAQQHNAAEELVVSLTAVLTIPRIHRFGAAIQLFGLHTANSNIRLERDFAISEEELLTLMAFSCIPITVASTILGSLWEPGITSNLVSQWLWPMIQEICPEILPRDQLIFVRMMAVRRPKTGPLCLGAALTGLLPNLVRLLSIWMPPVSLEAAEWTTSCQSFMNSQPLTHTVNDKSEILSIEDELRLLYMTDVDSIYYPSPPLSPWPLSGTTELRNVTIEVQNHVSCNHRLVYRRWSWIGKNGETFDDCGTLVQQPSGHEIIPTACGSTFANGNDCGIQKSSTHGSISAGDDRHMKRDGCGGDTLSHLATINLYRWYIIDGIKDKSLLRHDWLEDLLFEGGESPQISALPTDDGEGIDQKGELSENIGMRNGVDNVLGWLNDQQQYHDFAIPSFTHSPEPVASGLQAG